MKCMILEIILGMIYSISALMAKKQTKCGIDCNGVGSDNYKKNNGIFLKNYKYFKFEN